MSQEKTQDGAQGEPQVRSSAALARLRRAAGYFGIAMILLLFGTLLCTIPPGIRAIIGLLVIIVACWKLAKKEAR